MGQAQNKDRANNIIYALHLIAIPLRFYRQLISIVNADVSTTAMIGKDLEPQKLMTIKRNLE